MNLFNLFLHNFEQFSCVNHFHLHSFYLSPIHRLFISSCPNILSLDVLHSHSCFFVYVYCIWILPTDMHMHRKTIGFVDNTTTCWETLDSHFSSLQQKLKALSKSPHRCIFVCTRLWMCLKSCVINIGFTFIYGFAYNAVSEREREKEVQWTSHPSAIIRTIEERKGFLHTILIVMHKRLTIYCTITH